MTDRIWLSSPHMSDEGFEKHYIQEAFDTNWIAPLGANVTAFEQELAARVESKYAAALVSGTAAIHLALITAGVGAGDIVLCQDLTFAASANPVIYVNATPVFIDSDLKTWNMDPELLEAAFRKYGERVKAVIPVHLYGLSADMDPIMEICDRYGVPVIEDAAESLGTTYKGRPTGSIGKYGVLSFNGNKIITTSGGGMLVSNDREKIEAARFYSTQARDKAPYYQHSKIGYNYRLSNISAGIGRGQLKVLDQRVAKKRYIFDFYRRELAGIDGLTMMPINDWNLPNVWLSVIQLAGKVRPAQLIAALEAENIESRHVWKPMHLQPVFADCDYLGGDVGQQLFENGVCLPSDTKMTDQDLERVCSIIRRLC